MLMGFAVGLLGYRNAYLIPWLHLMAVYLQAITTFILLKSACVALV